MQKTSKLGKKHTPLIIGNWKMNPSTLQKAQLLFIDVKKTTSKKNAIAEVVIAPPFVYLTELQKISKNTRAALCAQDVSFEKEGAHTGEVSLSMLKSVGVSYVIIGHSERRAQGETNEEILKKTQATLKDGLIAVVCVGEKVRDAQGDYFSFVESQLKSMVKEIPKAHLKRLVIAYEPIWTIGTSTHATAEDVQEMKLFIQKVIADSLGRSMVSKIRIIYGGSVNSENAADLLEVGGADGFLIGGASLKPKDFTSIILIADIYAKA